MRLSKLYAPLINARTRDTDEKYVVRDTFDRKEA